MNETEVLLKSETLKWLKRLEDRVMKSHVVDQKANESMVNVKAYISDTSHFMAKGDFVRAFEAMVFASGIYETCVNLKLFEEK